MEFFKVERNDLNNGYMVFSDCEQLNQCFAFKGKIKANKAKDELNEQANKNFEKLKDLKMEPVLTWRKPNQTN